MIFITKKTTSAETWAPHLDLALAQIDLSEKVCLYFITIILKIFVIHYVLNGFPYLFYLIAKLYPYRGSFGEHGRSQSIERLKSREKTESAR